MGVDTRGFTAKKSLNQVLKAMRGLKYEIDKDFLNSMNKHGMKNFHMIPFTRQGEHRVISFGIYDSATNGLGDTLPKTGRKLKNSKQFSLLSLGANKSAYQILPEIVGALDGGYVQFLDTGDAPAIEVDEKGKLLDHNPLVGKKLILKTLRDQIYFNIDNFTLLSNEEAEKIFIHNVGAKYKPVVIYQRSKAQIYVLYVDKEGQPYISTVSLISDTQLAKACLEYGRKNKIYMTLKDIQY